MVARLQHDFLDYLSVWLVADLLAYFVRFGWGGVEAPTLLTAGATQAIALLALFLWRGDRRIRARDLVGVAIVATLANIVVAFVQPYEYSRLLLILQLLFGIGALLLTHQILVWVEDARSQASRG